MTFFIGGGHIACEIQAEGAGQFIREPNRSRKKQASLRRIETPSSRYGITTRLCITEKFLTFGSLIFD